MFFIFSKVLLIFILPFTWVLAMIIAALVVKKPKTKKKLLIVSLSLALIFSNPYLLNLFATSWDIKPVPLNNKPAFSCVIVLGGFSSVGSDGRGHFNGSADRFIEGLKLIDTHRATHILISGGNGSLFPNRFRESDWVKTQLKLFNVPDSSVLIENNSRNTIENAAFSKVLLDKNHLKPPYILVTSAFHMRRSLGIFKKAEIDVVPYPCNYMAGGTRFTFDQLLPEANALETWNIYIKEIIGVTINIFKKQGLQ